MPTTVRNTSPAVRAALVASQNLSRLDALKLRAGFIFHADCVPLTPIAAPTATDLPTSLVLLNASKAFYNLHIASACSATTGQGAHLATSTALATADATDLTTAEALANAIKAAYNTHRASATLHAVADSTNVVTLATATDLPTTVALSNDIKAQLIAHVAACFVDQAIAVVPR